MLLLWSGKHQNNRNSISYPNCFNFFDIGEQKTCVLVLLFPKSSVSYCLWRVRHRHGTRNLFCFNFKKVSSYFKACLKVENNLYKGTKKHRFICNHNFSILLPESEVITQISHQTSCGRLDIKGTIKAIYMKKRFRIRSSWSSRTRM